MGLSFGGMPAIVDGIVLELPNYMTMQIPLDLRDGQQAFDKITQAWEVSIIHLARGSLTHLTSL